MSRVISVHSFRGGTGKSNTTANIAALLAIEGRRVCIVDTDILSPGIHVLFGLEEDNASKSLNDYLWGKCNIEEAAQDVTERLNVPIKGRIYLVPSSMKAGDIATGAQGRLRRRSAQRRLPAVARRPKARRVDDRHSPRLERGDSAVHCHLRRTRHHHASRFARLPGDSSHGGGRAQAGCAAHGADRQQDSSVVQALPRSRRG